MENGNGEPELDLRLGTAFKVIEHKAHMEETVNETVNETVKQAAKFSLSDTHKKVFHQICMNDLITYAELIKATGLSRGHIARIISDLKEYGYIVRKGSDKSGSWEIRKSLTD